MVEERRERAIRLVGATRDLVDKTRGHLRVLRDVHAEIPLDGIIAVISSNAALRTTFLHLIAGSDVPDGGRVTSDGIRFSPIINAAGTASALMPQMSGIENIQFYARLHDVKIGAVVELVDLAVHLGAQLKIPMRKLSGIERRGFEVALFAALPYDCYLVDRIETLWPESRQLLVRSAEARAASVIFATDDLRVAKQISSVGFAIEDGSLRRHPHLRTGFRRTRANIAQTEAH